MDFKMKIQKFGGFLAGMVIPNIGAFIAWGLITALFLETGWFPNEQLATMISPMLTYLLPILIAYTGGRMVYDQRGAVAGVTAAMGAIIGSDIPMFLAAMILGPLGAWCIKQVDKLLDGKIKSGFEMLVGNFSIGIVGMLLAILSFHFIGPMIAMGTAFATKGINFIIELGFMPLLALIIEPAKVLFLNNAIDQGIFVPLGAADVLEHGKTIFFMMVSSPAPGAGILLAYSLFGKGNSQKSAPSALIIQFIGGIHEVYFPYVLMKPVMFLAIIAGGISQILVWLLLGAGLAGYPHPGSIVSFMLMLPSGGAIPVLLGIAAGIGVTTLIAAFFLKIDRSSHADEDVSLGDDIMDMLSLKQTTHDTTIQQSTELQVSDIKKVVFCCDAGIGSSAMGAGILQKKLKAAGFDYTIEHFPVDQAPKDAQVIVCHSKLRERASKAVPDAKIRCVDAFLNDPNYDKIIEEFKNGVLQ